MRSIIFCLLLLLSTPTFAEVKQLSLELRRTEMYRDSYFPGKRDWRGYVGLNWDISLWKYVFWDNKTYFYGDDAQVRKIGWQYDLGLRFEAVDIFYHHLSEHDADHGKDETGRIEKFPLENSYGIRINLLK